MNSTMDLPHGDVTFSCFSRVIFWFQMQTTYQVQGMHMRLDFVMNDSKEANCDPNKFNVGIFVLKKHCLI